MDFIDKLAQVLDFVSELNNQKKLILQEIAGGIQAINHLITTNKDAAASEGLQNLDDAFGDLNSTATQMTADTASSSVERMKSIVGNASFYTNPANAGTGYDAVTNIGGNYSPASFLNRTINHINVTEQLLAKQPKR